MENFKALLTQQAEAIKKDIETYTKKIEELEGDLEFEKERKSKAFRELRYIEKKLQKL